VKRALLSAAAAALLAGCSAATVTPQAVKPGHLVIGAADTSYRAFAASAGVKPAIVENYVHWLEPFSASFAGPAEPMIQILPRHAPLPAVAAGKYDAWLRSYAAQAKAYGRPVVLGFAPEMNGPWYEWGDTHVAPSAYIAAWRHVVEVFRQAGAVNVQWMWTVNVTTPGVSSPAEWWPGAQWVSLAGVDGYILSASQTFASLIAPTVADVRKLWGGPVILSETSVSLSAGQAEKIPALFAGASADRLAGVVWFDLKGGQDWALQGPAVAAFQAAAKEYGA
jgi:mannan endo-1,4-beta-mannosidase